MIRIRLRQMLDDKSFEEGRRITIGDISEATGISRATLTRIVNQPGYNARLEAIDELCGYFKCQPGDLLEYIDR